MREVLLRRYTAVCFALLGIFTSASADEPIESESPFTTRESRQAFDLATQGNAEGQFRLAEAYRLGNGVYKSLSEAAKWYLAAAKQGHAKSQYWLGTFYDRGRGVSKDPEEAFRWYKAAAEGGFAEAQYAVADAYLSGNGTEVDRKTAVEWLLKAGNGGSAGAQYVLALIYRDGLDSLAAPQGERAHAEEAGKSAAAWAIKDSPTESFRWAARSAKSGDSSAQNLLGRFYELGFGTAKDSKEARKWYRLSAEAGDADAQLNLAALLLNLPDGQADPDAAIDWLKKAVEQGHPDAQYLLALCYQTGVGADKNLDKAAALMTQASDQSLFGAAVTGKVSAELAKRSATKPAVALSRPISPTIDDKSEFLADEIEWLAGDPRAPVDMLVTKGGRVRSMAIAYLSGLTQLGESGSVNANRMLALLHEQGTILPKDPLKAMAFYRKAAEAGCADSQYRYALLLDKLRQDHAEAAEWHRRAAESGYGPAQWALSQAYREGAGLAKDDGEALNWALSAAQQGIVEAQQDVVTAFSNGRGTDKNPEEAAKWLKALAETTSNPNYRYQAALELLSLPDGARTSEALACLEEAAAAGLPEAKLQLGKLYLEGALVLRDTAKALPLLEAAEAEGQAEAAFLLGRHSEQKEPADWVGAIEHYRKAAELGFAPAQYRLGQYFLEKKGSLSEEEGIGWLIKASAQRMTEAQLRLGQWFIVQQDWVSARAWLALAAEAGDPEAQFRLGTIEAHGFAGDSNQTEAAKWYHEAAEAGHVEAMFALGDAYEKGYGMDQNSEEAVKWFSMAAEKGFSSAQYRLGRCFETGSGVSKNRKTAIEWYRAAAKQGHHDAQVALKKSRN